jgi:PST family polysaccharide transporter/lipopolysaccharide exporter
MMNLKKISALLKSNSLTAKFAKGGGILAIGSFAENMLRFARNMILARILAPEAFGLMATVISSVSVLEALTQVGLRQSTIQNKNSSNDNFLNAVWWISSLRGVVIYLMAFFASPYISAYFGRPDATDILRIGFLVFLFYGLISPRIHILEKELRFKKWVIMMQGAGIIGVIVAIALAFVLKNVWALLLGYLTEAALRTILSFILCPIKPTLKLDKFYTTEVLNFSRRMFGLPIIMMIYTQIDIFIIGKILSLKILGIYILVKHLAEMPIEFFSKIVHPVTLPVFSSMQEEKTKLNNTLTSVTRITGLFGIPLVAFFFLYGEPILNIVYGPVYSRLAIPFGILSISAMIVIISSLIVQMNFAIGQPNLHRTASLVRTIIFLILIYPATTFFGLTGTASAGLVAVTAMITIQLIYARKVVDLHPQKYMQNLLPGVLASLMIIVPSFVIKIFFTIEGFYFLLIGIGLCTTAWLYGINKTLKHI